MRRRKCEMCIMNMISTLIYVDDATKKTSFVGDFSYCIAHDSKDYAISVNRAQVYCVRYGIYTYDFE